MKTLLALALAVFSLPAAAQAAPYKLVILWGNDGVVAIDYPSKERCETAVTALKFRKAQEVENRKPKSTPGGGVLMSPPWQMEMICIPG